MFIDKVTVQIKAGNGGDGYVSFRNEKFVDRGGPDGGDGGDGGDVVALASNNQDTLATYRYDKRVFAEDGAKGFKRNQHGKTAPDLIVKLPVGTVVTDEEGVVRADLRVEGQQVVIAQGGKGGFGNAHFTSSTRQAPRFAEKGEEGEAYIAVFEIKMIAEVGIIGLPNAGKSTFLSVTTNAKPEIANYPFTTLTPNLGVTDLSKDASMLMADIPGLIEGASEGRGLGDEFLRHVERTAVFAHCIDAYSDDPAKDYATIRDELRQYDTALSKRPEVVLLTKIEGLDKEIIDMQVERLREVVPKKTKILPLSSVSGDGLKDALWALYGYVEKARKSVDKAAQEATVPVIKPEFDELEWHIDLLEDGKYRIRGRKLERFAMRTDIDNEEGVRRLKDILRKKGVIHELRRKGARAGAIIVFGSKKHSEITL